MKAVFTAVAPARASLSSGARWAFSRPYSEARSGWLRSHSRNWVSGRNRAKTYGSGGWALFFQTVTSQKALRTELLSTARYEATFMMVMHPNFPKKSV
jgi:hypothetical protein